MAGIYSTALHDLARPTVRLGVHICDIKSVSVCIVYKNIEIAIPRQGITYGNGTLSDGQQHDLHTTCYNQHIKFLQLQKRVQAPQTLILMLKNITHLTVYLSKFEQEQQLKRLV